MATRTAEEALAAMLGITPEELASVDAEIDAMSTATKAAHLVVGGFQAMLAVIGIDLPPGHSVLADDASGMITVTTLLPGDDAITTTRFLPVMEGVSN